MADELGVSAIVDDAITIGLEELTEKVQNEARASLQEVESALLDFEMKFKRFLDIKQQYSNAKNNPVQMSADSRIAKHQAEDEAYASFFRFQNAFNSYFGQRITILYVYNGPDNSFTLGLFDNDMSHLDRSNKYGALKYNIQQISKIFAYSLDEYDPRALDEVYREILYRWGVALSTHNKKQWLPLLWNINGWDGRKVANKGTFAEAYANFYVNQIPFDNESNMEVKVQNFITNATYGAASVDNTQGFAVGDIDKGAVQLAVKGTNASPQGMRQVYNLIQSLRSQLGAINEEFLSTFYNEISKSGKAKQVKKMTTEELNRSVNVMIDKQIPAKNRKLKKKITVQ